MTMPPHGPTSYHPPTSSSCPYGTPPSAPVPNRLLPIHGAEFSADPRATYAQLRAQGPIAPCELDRGVYAYITTTYRSALYLLRNTPRCSSRTRSTGRPYGKDRCPPTARPS